MGILSGLFRSRDKPTDRTAGSSYSFFLGGTASGKYVTERSAMRMTAVYCCVRILSEAVASLLDRQSKDPNQDHITNGSCNNRQVHIAP